MPDRLVHQEIILLLVAPGWPVHPISGSFYRGELGGRANWHFLMQELCWPDRDCLMQKVTLVVTLLEVSILRKPSWVAFAKLIQLISPYSKKSSGNELLLGFEQLHAFWTWQHSRLEPHFLLPALGVLCPWEPAWHSVFKTEEYWGVKALLGKRWLTLDTCFFSLFFMGAHLIRLLNT